jgi:hypothetical protein
LNHPTSAALACLRGLGTIRVASGLREYSS